MSKREEYEKGIQLYRTRGELAGTTDDEWLGWQLEGVKTQLERATKWLRQSVERLGYVDIRAIKLVEMASFVFEIEREQFERGLVDTQREHEAFCAIRDGVEQMELGFEDSPI